MKTPTIEQVRDYIIEKNYNLDAEAWWNSYDSKGWMVGKNKMVQWRSSVSNWAVNGWGKTAKSTKEYTRRNRRSDDGENARKTYGDYLRAKTKKALEDLAREIDKKTGYAGQIPGWLIKEVLNEKTT